MKAKLCLVAFLFMFFSLIALASVLVQPAAAKDPVIVGKWDRTDGVDVYTIYVNGTTQTIIDEQAYYGTWQYDGSSGYKYTFYWEHSPPGKAPFIDYVTVATDGQSYSGVNNYGDDFHCVRVGGADSTSTAGSGGFTIVPVAVGGGVAALVVAGVAIYWFSFAHRRAEYLADATSRGDLKSIADGNRAFQQAQAEAETDGYEYRAASPSTLSPSDPSPSKPIPNTLSPELKKEIEAVLKKIQAENPEPQSPSDHSQQPPESSG